MLRRMAAVLFGSVLGLVLAEGLTRGLDPLGVSYFRHLRAYRERLLRRSEIAGLHYEHVPGARLEAGHEIRINSLGLRGPEITLPKPPATFRILLLGDSVAFGWDVPEPATFARVLERDLSRALDREVELVNAGVVGYSTVMEQIWLDTRWFALDPDLVLVVASPNDILVEDDAVVSPPPAAAPRPEALKDVLSRFEWWVLSHRFDASAYDLLRFAVLVRLANPPPEDSPASDRYQRRRDRVVEVLRTCQRSIDQAACVAALGRIAVQCARRGVPLVVQPSGLLERGLFR